MRADEDATSDDEMMIRKASSAFALVPFLLALFACDDGTVTTDQPTNSGGSTAASTPAKEGTNSSCDLSKDEGYCVDFTAEVAAGTAKANCDNANSILGATNAVANDSGSCTKANRVGSCLANLAGMNETYRYYSGKFTTDTARTNCNSIKSSTGAAVTFTAN